MSTTTKSPSRTEEATTKVREEQGRSKRSAKSTESKKTQGARRAQTKHAGDSKTQAKQAQEGSKTQTKQVQEGSKTQAKQAGGKNQKLGKLGEEMACHYLRENEFDILEQNWKCKGGEADIIADEEGTLVFIEVKTRSMGYQGLPEYAVTKQKRARYEKIAVSYLMQNQRASGRVRFDVIAIQMTGKRQCLLRHHRDAFSADA